MPSRRYLFGCTIRFTPPAIAISQSPLRIAWLARWIAVSDDEHIVSSAMLGPCRFRKYETRFAIDREHRARPAGLQLGVGRLDRQLGTGPT